MAYSIQFKLNKGDEFQGPYGHLRQAKVNEIISKADTINPLKTIKELQNNGFSVDITDFVFDNETIH